jgi:hypothetical protein
MKWLRATTLLACAPLVAFAADAPAPKPPATRPNQPAATQPAAITLHLKDAPVRTLLDQFAAQAGAPVPLVAADLLGPNAPPVSIDLDRQPFWTALEAIGRKAHLEPVTDPDEPYPRLQLTLGNGAFWEEPHVVAGPVAIFANDVTRTQTAELGKARHEVERELALNLTAFVEPGLRVLAVSQQVKLKSAVDEKGRSLKPAHAADADEDTIRSPQDGVYSWELAVDLDCPPDVGRKIAKLAGQICVRVQTGSDRVEIDDVLKARNVTRTVAGVPFTFKKLDHIAEDYHLAFTIERRNLPAARWQDLHHSAYQGQMMLLDAQGRVVCGRAAEQNGDYGHKKIDATIRVFNEPGITDPSAGPPAKLVWLAPTDAKTIPIDFELTNLPIPE